MMGLGAIPSKAQEPGQDDVIRVRTDLVTVPIMVFDAMGRRVAGLKETDFLIRDDSKSRRPDHFSNGSDRVALVFLLDASGSASNYLTKQRETALAIFARFGPGSQIAVLRFSERAQTPVPFTGDIANARRGFDFPSTTERHTAIFDSVATAIQLLNQRKADPAERRIIILTSDGLDTASTTRAATVINNAREDDITIYVIHFPLFAPSDGRLTVRPTAKGFRDLAEKTGGRYFMAGDIKSALEPGAPYDLAPVFKAIEDDLASQYLLGFYPDAAQSNTRQHRIAVELRGKPRGYRLKILRDSYSLNR